MNQWLRSTLRKIRLKGLHYIETRYSRYPDKLGWFHHFLEGTWFDPEVRPFSIESVKKSIREHSFKCVAVALCGSRSDSNVAELLRACRELNVVLTTLNRNITSFNNREVKPLSPELLDGVDGIIVVDANPEEHLNVLRYCYEQGVYKPVITDFSRLPWVGGQAPFFSGDLETNLYVHNHFAEVFGIKDPIQIFYEICDGPLVKEKGFKLLGPNETIRFSSKELRLGSLTNGVFKHIAHHPGFVKLPHRRFRVAVDVENAWSHCLQHGLERRLEGSASRKGSMIDPVVFRLGPQSDVLLTAIRSDTSSRLDEPLCVSLTAMIGEVEFRSTPLWVTPTQRCVTVSAKDFLGLSDLQDEYIRILASISGPCNRLCWMGVEKVRGREILSGNHGFLPSKKVGETVLDTDGSLLNDQTAGAKDSVAIVKIQAQDLFLRRSHVRKDASIRGCGRSSNGISEIKALQQKDVFVYPYPVPIFPSGYGVHSAFTFVSSLPPLEHFQLITFDVKGHLCDRQEVRLNFQPGPYIETQPLVPPSVREMGGLMLVAPLYDREGFLPNQRLIAGYLRVQDIRSGDQDYVEMQHCWRNVVGYYPNYPSGFGERPGLAKNRTSLMIRAVHDGEYICLVLASGDLRFAKRDAPVELRYFQPDGRSISTWLSMNAWTVQIVKIEEIFPELNEFSPAGYGWIRVTSSSVDLNGLCIERRKKVNSIAIQHLWGQ